MSPRCVVSADPTLRVHLAYEGDAEPYWRGQLAGYLADNEDSPEFCERVRALPVGGSMRVPSSWDYNPVVLTIIAAPTAEPSGASATDALPPAPEGSASGPLDVCDELTFAALHARAIEAHGLLASLESDIARIVVDGDEEEHSRTRASAFADATTDLCWRVVCALGAELDR